MAEREGRQILEEDCNEENIQSPFQPISNVISVVCVLLLHSERKLTFHWSLKNCHLFFFHFQYDNKEKMNMMKDTAYQLSHKERWGWNKGYEFPNSYIKSNLKAIWFCFMLKAFYHF